LAAILENGVFLRIEYETRILTSSPIFIVFEFCIPNMKTFKRPLKPKGADPGGGKGVQCPPIIDEGESRVFAPPKKKLNYSSFAPPQIKLLRAVIFKVVKILTPDKGVLQKVSLLYLTKKISRILAAD